MRKPDPERIYLARRAAILSRLTGAGVGPGQAEALVAAWEVHAVTLSVERQTVAFWDEAWLRITEQRARP